MNVDLTPIVQVVASVAMVVLTTLGGLLIQKVAKKFGLQADAALTQNLTTAANAGINYAVMKGTAEIAAKGWDHPDVANSTIAAGANYVAAKFPDLLAKAGIDSTTPAGVKNIQDIVTRAMPDAMSQAAASPVTPATAPTSGASS